MFTEIILSGLVKKIKKAASWTELDEASIKRKLKDVFIDIDEADVVKITFAVFQICTESSKAALKFGTEH